MIEQNIFGKDRNFNGVKGLVFIDDKIVAYRRDNKTKSYPLYIDLPGGGKEDVESAFETFQREVKEEFGIGIEKDDITYAKQYISQMDSSKESYFIVVKTKNIKGGDIIFGNEGLEYFLFTLEEYLKLEDSIPRQKDKIIEYLSKNK